MTISNPTGPTCPICSKPALPAHKPFCSPRCQQIDLGKWLNGSYRIPAVPVDDNEADSLSEFGEE